MFSFFRRNKKNSEPKAQEQVPDNSVAPQTGSAQSGASTIGAPEGGGTQASSNQESGTQASSTSFSPAFQETYPPSPAQLPEAQLSQPPIANAPLSKANEEPTPAPPPAVESSTPSIEPLAVGVAQPQNAPEEIKQQRTGWLGKLTGSLRKTGSSIASVFINTQIDQQLYDDLEAALLQADAGVAATQALLNDLKARVKASRTNDPSTVRIMLVQAIAQMLKPLQKVLVVGQYHPTIIMVEGVNGAGKTTSIGKLTRHMANANATVLLAAADTFRAAAREQLAIWADRNQVEIISQQGADPAAVAFDAITAGRARGHDVVLIDTAGRLPTQKHLMDELSKIARVVTRADATAPHEVLLVIDGNTGQNALAQVKAFNNATPLSGLIVTKLDGTAKGGVLCAIAREIPIPVYFIGVGEQLADLQTFDSNEFAQALVGIELPARFQ